MTPNEHCQISRQPRNGILFLKGVFGALCCMAGAGVAALWSEIRVGGYDNIVIGHDPAKVIVSVIGFACLLAVARWLRACGKHSESWAFLGYSAWMLLPVSICLFIQDRGNTPLAGFGFMLVLICAWGGLEAVLQDNWKALLLWWLASNLFPWLLTLCLP